MKLRAPQVLKLVFVVMAVIVAVLWLALSREPASARAALPAPRTASPREPAMRREPLASAAEAPRDSSPMAARAAVESPGEASSTDARVESTAEKLVVAGVLVVHEPDGSVRRDADGTMDLLFWLGAGGSRVTVDVVKGRWRARLVKRPEGGFSSSDGGFHREGIQAARITAREPALTDAGGTVALVDEDRSFRFGDEDVVIHARRLTPILVHVEDAQTGSALDEVSILAVREWEGHGHPGDTEASVLVENASSPIELMPPSKLLGPGNKSCLAGSPGYAWTAFEIDLRGGGERRVRLERGGDLEVFLEGDRGPPGAELRLRRAGKERPFASHAIDGDRPIVFRGLVPGAYELCVEVGDRWYTRLVLARGEVEVVAAGVAQVTLVLDTPPGLVTAPLSGRVVLPDAWKLDSFYLSLHLLGTPLDGTNGRRTLFPESLQRVPGTDEYAFDFGDVQVGTYSLTLGRLTYGMVFDLGPGGRSDLTLVVPPPVEVTVLPRDEATGEPAAVELLFWNCERPAGTSGGALERAYPEPGADRIRLRVPRAQISIMVSGGEYLWKTHTFFAEEGLDVVLDVRRAGGAMVRLRDGDTNVPWPEDDYGSATALSGQGRLGARGRRGGGLWLTVTEPGRYRIEVPRVAGFEPHDPVEVDLVTGEMKEVTVDLERLP